LRIYLPDLQRVSEWKSLAKEHGQSLSKFVIERVEDSLSRNGEGPRYTRKELIDRTFELEKEVKHLKEDLDMKTKAYRALEQELQILRVRPFMSPVAQGMKEVNDTIIQLFRKKKRINYDDILPLLGVKPTDMDLVKSVNNQIEMMIGYGLLKQDLKGWRWLD